MKAILLVSSIFYLLGLKISNTVDIFKRDSNVEPVVLDQPVSKDETKNASYTKELKAVPTEPDSTSVSGSNQALAPKVEE